MADKSGDVSEAATCNLASASCVLLLPINALPVTVAPLLVVAPLEIVPAKVAFADVSIVNATPVPSESEISKFLLA